MNEIRTEVRILKDMRQHRRERLPREWFGNGISFQAIINSDRTRLLRDYTATDAGMDGAVIGVSLIDVLSC